MHGFVVQVRREKPAANSNRGCGRHENPTALWALKNHILGKAPFDNQRPYYPGFRGGVRVCAPNEKSRPKAARDTQTASARSVRPHPFDKVYQAVEKSEYNGAANQWLNQDH